jgi:hypothetical protein
MTNFNELDIQFTRTPIEPKVRSLQVDEDGMVGIWDEKNQRGYKVPVEDFLGTHDDIKAMHDIDLEKEMLNEDSNDQ